MAVNKDYPYRTFGRWLAKHRRIEGLTQEEAVNKMRKLNPRGKGVRVETWSRWESGHRLPPRTKIDLVAQTINAFPKSVRQRAGYEASVRPIRRNRSNVIASMLKVLSSDSSIEAKILNLYALGAKDRHQITPAARRKLIIEIARAFDKLKGVSEQVRIAAIERIRQICREASEDVQFTVPPDRATMIIPKKGFPPVMIGTQIEIEYRDIEGYMVSDIYVVRRIKHRKNRILARIVCVDHTDFTASTEIRVEKEPR